MGALRGGGVGECVNVWSVFRMLSALTSGESVGLRRVCSQVVNEVAGEWVSC